MARNPMDESRRHERRKGDMREDRSEMPMRTAKMMKPGKTGYKSSVKKTGTYAGKSNKLGYGGRAAQLKAKGVPGGVIGNLARKAGAAPGGPNYHGKRK